MKRIGTFTLGLLAALVLRAATPAGMAKEGYRIGLAGIERLERLFESIPKDERGEVADESDPWKTVFAEFGVTWPERSSIRWFKTLGKLVVVNTERNLAKMEKLVHDLGLLPMQVEIDVRLLAAERAALESVGYFSLSRPSATNLYAQLRKRADVSIVSTPRVVTRSSEQAEVKGVKTVGCPDGSTQEVGTTLNVTPYISDGHYGLVDLRLCLQHIGASGPSPSVVTVSENVNLPAGATSVLGGVTDGTEKGKDTFYLVFVTPRVLDLDGNEVKFE